MRGIHLNRRLNPAVLDGAVPVDARLGAHSIRRSKAHLFKKRRFALARIQAPAARVGVEDKGEIDVGEGGHRRRTGLTLRKRRLNFSTESRAGRLRQKYGPAQWSRVYVDCPYARSQPGL